MLSLAGRMRRAFEGKLINLLVKQGLKVLLIHTRHKIRDLLTTIKGFTAENNSGK